MKHERLIFPTSVCPLCQGECKHKSLEFHRRAQATLAICPLCEGTCRHKDMLKAEPQRETLPIDIRTEPFQGRCWGCEKPYTECYPEVSNETCETMHLAYSTMLNNQTMTACGHVVSECTNPACAEAGVDAAPISCTKCMQRGLNCVCEYVKEHGREMLYDSFYRLTPGMYSKYSVRIPLIDERGTYQAALDRLKNYFGCLFAEDDTIHCEIAEYLEATMWGTEEADLDYEHDLLEDYCMHINRRLAPIDMVLVEDPRNTDLLEVFVQREYDTIIMKRAKESLNATNS